MKQDLITEPNLAAPDDMYAALIDMHRDLTVEQSSLVNAKLILLLVNYIGDQNVIHTAIARARSGITIQSEAGTTGQAGS